MLEAGLPNITGTVNGVDSSVDGTRGDGAFASSTGGEPFSSWGGALYKYGAGSETGSSSGSGGGVGLNANLSNTIYGASDTVQPPALQLISQIKF